MSIYDRAEALLKEYDQVAAALGIIRDRLDAMTKLEEDTRTALIEIRARIGQPPIAEEQPEPHVAEREGVRE